MTLSSHTFTRHMHIDLETFSPINLKERGLYVYATDPETEILMTAVAYNDDSPVHLDFTAIKPPQWLLDDLVDPTVEKLAFNAPFEFELLTQVWGLQLDMSQWTDVAVLARSLSFTGSLDMVGERVGIAPDIRKLATGKALIRRFCQPKIPTKNDPYTRHTRETHPREWAEFCAYNVQDTEAERGVYNRILPYLRFSHPPQERRLWLLDQKINRRGLPIDTHLVRSGMARYEENKKHLLKRIQKIAHIDNANSGAQVQGWLAQQGVVLDDLTKETVRDTLLRTDLPSGARKVLELRREASRTSPTKFNAFDARTSADHRMRGGFQFYGAARTGRWAGQGVQVHNLISSTLGGNSLEEIQQRLAIAIDALKTSNIETLDMMYPSVTDVLVSTIRCCIAAPRGKQLRVADLASIETVVIGWIAGSKRILQLFSTGMDAYKDYATEVFGVAYSDVTKAQRKFCKPPVLGCGFALGGDGLVAYAQGFGVDLSEMFREEDKWLLPELENPGEVDGDWLSDEQRARAAGKRLVNVYRTAYPEVPALWRTLKVAAFRAVQHRTKVQAGVVTYEYVKPFLFCHLPSGRSLAYFKPKILTIKHPKMGEVTSLTYEGMNQFTRKWCRLATHPGKLTENIVQAVARDILGHGLINADESGEFEIVGHVHDEIMALTDRNGGADYKALIECMTDLPEWARGMPVGAAGWEGNFYLKD